MLAWSGTGEAVMVWGALRLSAAAAGGATQTGVTARQAFYILDGWGVAGLQSELHCTASQQLAPSVLDNAIFPCFTARGAARRSLGAALIDLVLQVLERGLKAIPLSVDLWIHYLNHVKATRTEDHAYIKSQYEKAIGKCTDFSFRINTFCFAFKFLLIFQII